MEFWGVLSGNKAKGLIDWRYTPTTEEQYILHTLDLHIKCTPRNRILNFRRINTLENEEK